MSDTPETITIQEAWIAAGGNPGITATRADLLQALTSMDKAVDQCDEMHKNSFIAQLADAPTFSVVWDGMHDGKQLGKLDCDASELEPFIGKTVKIIVVG